MFVLVVGAGRVGAALATSALRQWPHRVGPRRGPAVARAARRRARPLVGGGRRPLHDRHRARGRRADRGRRSRRPTSSSPPPTATTRTSWSRRSRSARFDVERVIARVLDPRRAAWYAEQGAADDLPDADRDRAARAGGARRSADGHGLYVIIAGAGKVGWNLARELLEKGHEVTCIEQDRRRYLTVEQELEHAVQYGDATELWVLERAGIQRADLVVAVTGDDEDNLLICQVAKEKYLCERIIARVNNPRNLDHFKLLGIQPAVSRDRPDPAPDRARGAALRARAPARPAGGAAGDHRARGRPTTRPPRAARSPTWGCPTGALVISVLRGGSGFVPEGRHGRRGGRRGARRARSGHRRGHHRAVRRRKWARLRPRFPYHSPARRTRRRRSATPRSACEQRAPLRPGPSGHRRRERQAVRPSPGRAATAATSRAPKVG